MQNTLTSKKKMGNSDLEVAPLVLGGNVFGWTIDAPTSFAVLDAFVDRGFNMIDTANMYSAWVPGNQGGESETIIGDWLQKSGKRDRVLIATKVGMPMGDGSKGLKKDYIIASVEQSLKRLKTDRIDLYQSHADDADTPLQETLEAYDALIKAGKVRYIGASNYSAERLREAIEISKQHGLPQYISLQPEYNLYDRSGFEAQLEPLCLEQNVGVIPYYSLASGFLTGKYRSQADLAKSVRGKGIGEKYLNERGQNILAALDEISRAHDTTLTAIALAWLNQRKSITAPIASATSVAQLDELAAATSIKLSDQDVARLEANAGAASAR